MKWKIKVVENKNSILKLRTSTSTVFKKNVISYVPPLNTTPLIVHGVKINHFEQLKTGYISNKRQEVGVQVLQKQLISNSSAHHITVFRFLNIEQSVSKSTSKQLLLPRHELYCNNAKV